MSARGYTAAGVTFRQCRDCGGAGEHVFQAPNRDPDLEEVVRCACCGGTGYIRETRVDALEALQAERRSALRIGRAPANSLPGFLAPTATRTYREARALAMAPARLPTDVAPRAALERAA